MVLLRSNKPLQMQSNALWDFSVDFYADSMNREALLFLQSHYDLNVNLMLALLWFAKSGRGTLNKTTINKLNQAIEPWQETITKEFRHLRQKLPKEKNPELYEAVLNAEIFSEKIQQHLIFDFFIDSPTKPTSSSKKAKDGTHNIQTYFSVCKANLSEVAYQHTRHLLAQAFNAFKEYDFPQLSLGLE